MKYYDSEKCEYDDGLIGGIGFTEVVNVSVSSAVERGELLAETASICAAVSSASDSVKPLYIAAESIDSVGGMVPAYSAGVFNKDKIIISESLEADTFRQALREQNIHMR